LVVTKKSYGKAPLHLKAITDEVVEKWMKIYEPLNSTAPLFHSVEVQDLSTDPVIKCACTQSPAGGLPAAETLASSEHHAG
jgi:hypothetical protein